MFYQARKRSQEGSTPSQGFTLIELLVVIAIIAILAAILFPVFAKAREKARQITCLSNEKQINLAMMQYVQDFDETMPAATITTNIYDSSQPHYSWAYVVYPYVKSKNVWVCPDDKSDLLNEPAGGRYANNFDSTDDITRSYAVIYQYHGMNTPGNTANPSDETAMMIEGHANDNDPDITLASIPEPANTIWLMESGQNINVATGACYDNPCADVVDADGEDVGAYLVSDRANWVAGGSHANYVAQYHTGGANYGYGDGHCKWQHIEQLINTTNGEADAFLRLKS